MPSDDYLAWVRALEQDGYPREPLTEAELAAWLAAHSVDWSDALDDLDDDDASTAIVCKRCDWRRELTEECVCPMPCECNVFVRQAIDHNKTHQ